MQDGCKILRGFLHGIEWIMFHESSGLFSKTTSWRQTYTN
jgi:hypothetical protein